MPPLAGEGTVLAFTSHHDGWVYFHESPYPTSAQGECMIALGANRGLSVIQRSFDEIRALREGVILVNVDIQHIVNTGGNRTFQIVVLR